MEYPPAEQLFTLICFAILVVLVVGGLMEAKR